MEQLDQMIELLQRMLAQLSQTNENVTGVSNTLTDVQGALKAIFVGMFVLAGLWFLYRTVQAWAAERHAQREWDSLDKYVAAFVEEGE